MGQRVKGYVNTSNLSSKLIHLFFLSTNEGVSSKYLNYFILLVFFQPSSHLFYYYCLFFFISLSQFAGKFIRSVQLFVCLSLLLLCLHFSFFLCGDVVYFWGNVSLNIACLGVVFNYFMMDAGPVFICRVVNFVL